MIFLVLMFMCGMQWTNTDFIGLGLIELLSTIAKVHYNQDISILIVNADGQMDAADDLLEDLMRRKCCSVCS